MPETSGSEVSSTGSSPGEMLEDESTEVKAMYIKVHMVGCPIGRRINIEVHDNYESLCRALHKLSNNFLSVVYLSEGFYPDDELEDVKEAAKDTLFIYENNEGDRGIVGSVPWRVFSSTVKRLYIFARP